MSTPPRDFADALRAAISRRGLSLQRLRVHLRRHGHELSVATLSYWQSGRSRPERSTSLAAVASLEEILEVEPGGLARFVPALTPAPTRTSPDARLADLCAEGSAVDEVVGRLGLSWDDGLERISVHDSLRLRPDRTESTHVVRESMRAYRDGVDRYPICFGYEEDAEEVVVTGIDNVVVGRVLDITEHRLVLIELCLPRPLALGEPILVEYGIDTFGASVASTYWERGMFGPVRDMHISVHFARDDVPLFTEWYTEFDGREAGGPIVMTGASVHHHVHDMPPGSVGVRWRW